MILLDLLMSLGALAVRWLDRFLGTDPDWRWRDW